MLLVGPRGAEELLDALVAATPPAERESLTAETLQRQLKLLADNALLVG